MKVLALMGVWEVGILFITKVNSDFRQGDIGLDRH